MIAAIKEFIVTNMGQAFLEMPHTDLASIYKDTSSSTPVLFILNAGSDPLKELLRFAFERGFKDRFVNCSINLLLTGELKICYVTTNKFLHIYV